MENNSAMSFFKTVENTGILNSIGYSMHDLTAYNPDSRDPSLDTDLDVGKIILKDPMAEWKISLHGLEMKWNLCITSPLILFSKDGVAEHGSLLGVAVRFSSPASNRSEVFKIAEFGSEKEKLFQEIKIQIDRGLFKNDIKMDILLYLIKPKGTGAKGYAHRPGTILGTLDTRVITANDRKYIFPVMYVEDSDGPLWWVECKWTDATEDLFNQENVCICLNNAHKHSKKIDQDAEGDFCAPLLAEIISSCIQLILERSKENDDWKKNTTESNLLDGSVAFILRYIIKRFKLDISSSEKLAKEIRKQVYEIMA